MHSVYSVYVLRTLSCLARLWGGGRCGWCGWWGWCAWWCSACKWCGGLASASSITSSPPSAAQPSSPPPLQHGPLFAGDLSFARPASELEPGSTVQTPQRPAITRIARIVYLLQNLPLCGGGSILHQYYARSVFKFNPVTLYSRAASPRLVGGKALSRSR